MSRQRAGSSRLSASSMSRAARGVRLRRFDVQRGGRVQCAAEPGHRRGRRTVAERRCVAAPQALIACAIKARRSGGRRSSTAQDEDSNDASTGDVVPKARCRPSVTAIISLLRALRRRS